MLVNEFDMLMRGGGGLPSLVEFVDRPPWMADALCREYPHVEFYIGQGGDPEPAKAVCGRCAVRDECRSYALEHGEEFGIWGGVAASVRLRLLGKRRAA